LILVPRLISAAAEADIIDGWQQFERRVRDDRISYEDGLKEIKVWWGVLQKAYPAERLDSRIFFPLRGYGLKQVGGLWQSRLLTVASLEIASFGEDESGELYALDLNGGVYAISAR